MEPTLARPVFTPDENTLWQAVLDYCRPGCPSRRPRREQVSFYPHCAEAEQAGYRACKRCRPQEALALSARVDLVERACRLIEATSCSLAIIPPDYLAPPPRRPAGSRQPAADGGRLPPIALPLSPFLAGADCWVMVRLLYGRSFETAWGGRSCLAGAGSFDSLHPCAGRSVDRARHRRRCAPRCPLAGTRPRLGIGRPGGPAHRDRR